MALLQEILGQKPQSQQERLFQPYVDPFHTKWQCLEWVRLYGSGDYTLAVKSDIRHVCN